MTKLLSRIPRVINVLRNIYMNNVWRRELLRLVDVLMEHYDKDTYPTEESWRHYSKLGNQWVKELHVILKMLDDHILKLKDCIWTNTTINTKDWK